MHFSLLALALQLQVATAAHPLPRARDAGADSARDLRRARDAQASFERGRRALLPIGSASAGRCDVRLGRFCWWYDEAPPVFPPEPQSVAQRRDGLLGTLDLYATAYPGDDWLAGMRVHYRVEAGRAAEADSIARSCGASPWWCASLRGFVAHAEGRDSAADSAFRAARVLMPSEIACTWNDVAPLLTREIRSAYEKLSCEARAPIEDRYWMLSRAQLSTTGDAWRHEYAARRVLAWLAQRAATPQGLSWGADAAELLLRYGWPVAWSRTPTAPMSAVEPSIIGHDPSPSFSFAPEHWLDSTADATPERWNPRVQTSESRFAPKRVRRMTEMSAQLARFRRGDSTLLVAAFAAQDDSLMHPTAVLGALASADSVVIGIADSVRIGIARVVLPFTPRVAGVEVADTATKTLARARQAYAVRSDSGNTSLSDLLLYRAGDRPAESVDDALPSAIPGDTVSRAKAIGLFWETYALPNAGDADTMSLAVSVERMDRGFMRSARQRLGLRDPDSPVRIRWTDAQPARGDVVPHAVSLDLRDLEPGRYRITLSVASNGRQAAAVREISLIR